MKAKPKKKSVPFLGKNKPQIQLEELHILPLNLKFAVGKDGVTRIEHGSTGIFEVIRETAGKAGKVVERTKFVNLPLSFKEIVFFPQI